MPKSRVAFVTGSTGCVGLNLVECLSRRRWNVVAATRRGSEGLPYLEELGTKHPNIKIEMYTGLCDLDGMTNIIPLNCDCVFHVAADTSLWWRDAGRQYQTNVVGTKTLCEAAVTRKVKRLVLTSSLAALGRVHGSVDDSTPSKALESDISYQKTKYQAELVAKDLMKEAKIPLVILRPAIIFGRYDLHTWSRTFTMVASGKVNIAPPGASSFIHTDQVALAHVMAADKGDGETFLLGGVNSTYKEFFNELHKVVGTGREGKLAVVPAPLLWIRALLSELWSFLRANNLFGLTAQPLSVMVQDSHKWLLTSGFLDKVKTEQHHK